MRKNQFYLYQFWENQERPVCFLFSHCQGSDPPQKHAGAGSPSPAVVNNSSYYQTTLEEATEQVAHTPHTQAA